MMLWTEKITTQIDRTGMNEKTDVLINEILYDFYIDGNFMITFACTPRDLDYLAAGYAFSHGLLKGKSDIKDFRIDEEKRRIHLTTLGAGMTGSCKDKSTDKDKSTEEGPFLTQKQIFRLWKTFDQHSHLFLKTGSAHSAALFSGEEVVILMEDVARHNALDKVIGKAMFEEIDTKGLSLVFSGRVAADMVKAASSLDVKIMLCHGASTSGAVAIAEEEGITLAGFVSEKRMNVYTHSSRIVFEG